MTNLLVVCGHTDLKNSVANKAILENLRKEFPSAEIDELITLYPDYKFDVKAEQEIRQQLIQQNLLLAVIALPPNMFESTSIPTCILVFDKHKETRMTAMIDLTERCEEETRDQRGQFGGNSHTGRTYHKTVNVIPPEVMGECIDLIESKQDEPSLCKWIQPEELEKNDWNHAIQIKMNRTAARRLGYDCMNTDIPDLSESFGVVGQKASKEKNISFTAEDGITIKISTKDEIHPLILDFLNHWKQMIIYLNNEENRYLAEFRDALLPELMSGKIAL